MACDPAQLLSTVQCFQCLPRGQRRLIENALYCNIRNGVPPGAGGNCDVQALLASAAPFQGFPAGQLSLLEAALLCNIQQGIVPASVSAVSPASSLLNGLVAYYKMGESGSSARADSSGNGNLLNAFGLPLTSPGPSGLGDALLLNGVNQSLRANTIGGGGTTPFNLAGGSFTLTVWVYITANPVADQFITGIWYPSQNDCSFRLYLRADGVLFVEISQDGTAGNIVGQGQANILLNTWTFLALGVDATKKQFNLGEGVVPNDPNLPLQFTPGFSYTSIFKAVNTQNAFEVGDNRDSNAKWAGSIDGVGFWNRVLTNAEIAKLFNNANGLEFPWN